ncbi:hypothetical protein ACQRCG_04895 [Bacillus altitudinis]|uniref:hypothetical protein n=1 Tax=Bacillus altitudinis TaxID=293387 RepID=UPI003D010709
MISIKNVKDGGVAYIFGAEYVEVAKALFPQFAQRLLGVEDGASIVKGSDLAGVRERIERALPAHQVNIEKYTRLNGLSAEKASSVLISILYDKLENPSPPKLKPFYTDLEAVLGVQFTRLHKQRLSAPKAHNGKYPHRKMDTVLLHANREALLEFAENYVFGG